MLSLALTVLVGFALAVALVPVCRALARRYGYTAKPKEDRWHRTPTALLGGVGVALGVYLGHLWLHDWLALPVLLFGGALIFGVGLADDLLDLKPYTKLVAEIAIASVFVFYGYRLSWVTSLTLDTLLTMVWIVGLTNAFNLLDNMDGLCAGTTLITGTALLASTVLAAGVTPEASHLALLLGATGGFLVFNAHPASIFLGDSGSLFIGFNLAVLTLAAQQGNGSSSVLSTVAGPLLVLLIPIFDTTLVTAMRFLSGRSAAQGGRDHTSHRLVAMGLSERAAVAVLWTLSALGGLLALSIARFQDGWSAVGALVFVLTMIILAVYLAQVRVYDDADEALLQSGQITPFTIPFLYKRRIAEVLLDFCLAAIAYYAAYRLRYERPAEFGQSFPNFLRSLPIVVGLQVVALFVVGGYRGVWRYFGLMDGMTFAWAIILGTVSAVAVIVAVYGFAGYSASVFVIYGVLLLLALSGSRASFRLIGEFAHRRRHAGQRLIIYGVGDGAALAVRELLQQAATEYRMLGFIHDDPNLARSRMQGYSVLGDSSTLLDLVAGDAVDTVVITASVPEDRLAQLRAACDEHDVHLARLHWRLDEIASPS